MLILSQLFVYHILGRLYLRYRTQKFCHRCSRQYSIQTSRIYDGGDCIRPCALVNDWEGQYCTVQEIADVSFLLAFDRRELFVSDTGDAVVMGELICER